MIPKTRLIKEIEIPAQVQVQIGKEMKITGPAGTITKKLVHPTIKISKKEKKIILEPLKFTQKEKKMINTFQAHIRNMLKGAQTPFTYKLKIVSTHFPMSVNVEGDKVIIKNFFGEKIPRTAKILADTTVKIEGDIIIVESANKESAGQTAANIEKSTRRSNYDKRVFQDGIWITERGGKPIK